MFGNRNRTELANITYNELDRQRAIVDKERKDAHTRKHNIQYVAIGIGVLTLIILFLLYSRSILGKEKLIKLLGVVVLLIVFEFINLLIHPYLAKATNESPLSMLLVMVGIAALLVPAHHRIEEWVRHQLVEKNKRIRLEAAKKTIQKLEKNS